MIFGKKDTMRAALLEAVRLNARAIRDATSNRDELIVRAVERGIPQTAVAEAADLSQPHISRIVTANKKANEARKAARRSKRSKSGGTV